MNASRKMFFSVITSAGEAHDLDTLAGYVQKIEKAGFSAFLVRDNAPEEGAFEPLTLLAALSTLTGRIGLVPTASTRHSEPYHVARRLASLDHMSGGRAGWNIESLDEEAAERAGEFLQITKGLWDSYADGAVVADKKAGVYFLPDQRQPLNHKGKYFRVAGPLNVSRSPQAYPVFFYAVRGEADMDFATRNAEVVLVPASFPEDAFAFRKIFDEALARAGRESGSIQVWVEMTPESLTGSAEETIRRVTEWHESGVAYGFALPLAGNIAHIEKFIKEVLPVLTHRGLFSAPEGKTLRESLGLARPLRDRR